MGHDEKTKSKTVGIQEEETQIKNRENTHGCTVEHVHYVEFKIQIGQ